MEHFYKSVTGWAAFANLYREQVRAAPRTRQSRFVEVGSWLGKSAALMAVEIENSGKNIEFICVDPWLDGGDALRNSKTFLALGKKDIYETFLQNVQPVIHRIKPMRMPSVEAARLMEDESVDFLMIDGDHSYEAVKADIAEWMPKMRPGGTISGDDYTRPGVERAVLEAFPASRVQTYINHGKPRKANPKSEASYWWVQL